MVALGLSGAETWQGGLRQPLRLNVSHQSLHLLLDCLLRCIHALHLLLGRGLAHRQFLDLRGQDCKCCVVCGP